LFNLYGEVIGINTAIDARAQGIGFAIPINVVKSVVKQIIEKGEVTLGWVGVTIDDLQPQVAKSLGLPKNVEGGALIMEPIPGQPAQKAGLKSYDVIVDVNGKPVDSARDFRIAVGNMAVGQKTNLKFYRDGKLMQTTLTVGKRPSQKELAKLDQQPSLGDGKPVGKTGLILSDLTPPLRAQLQLDATARGAVVVGVDPNGLGAAAGFQPGDVILEVNRKSVKNRAEAEAALKEKRDSYLLKVQRGSATVLVLLDTNAND
jgi:S1-C subfamily serine protease